MVIIKEENFMRTKFRRTVSFILAGVMITALSTGCGKQAKDKDESGRTIVSVSNYPSAEGKAKDNFDNAIAKFEKNNPDVVIKPDQWTFDLKSFYAKAAGGQLPTIFNSYFTEVGPSIEAGYISDITDVLKKRGYEGKFNPVLEDIIGRDGKIYAIPSSAYVLGLAYNVELFEKAGLMNEDGTPKQPKDWDEMVEFAIKIKEKTGAAGFQFPSTDNAGGWIFTCLAWSYGADFVKENEDGGYTAVFDSPEAVEALQFLKDLKWKYDVLPAEMLVSNSKTEEYFGTGQVGMYITAGDYPTKLKAYNTDVDTIGLMALPAGPKKHVTLLGGGVKMISANATEDQIDAAIRWHESSMNYKLTDNVKESINNTLSNMVENGILVGVKSMSPWSKETEYLNYYYDMIDEYANSDMNHVKLYNDFVENCPAEVRPEERICAQELYAILDTCIQAVWSDENSDPAEVLAKANNDFQNDYLNNY